MFVSKLLYSILYFYSHFCCSVNEMQLAESRNILTNYTFNSHVKLGDYVNDVQGFFPYVKQLKSSIFKFYEEDMKSANLIFSTMKNTYTATRKHNITGDITMVSIHVRLTDFKHHLKILFNMEFTPNSFFTAAMSYYAKKYKVIKYLSKYCNYQILMIELIYTS